MKDFNDPNEYLQGDYMYVRQDRIKDLANHKFDQGWKIGLVAGIIFITLINAFVYYVL